MVEQREASSPTYQAKLQRALEELVAAVLYLGPDGTKKLCGDRCSMHVESGENKDSCTIHSPDLFIPNLASCGWYKKGPAATGHMAMPMKPFVDPKVSGLIYGDVQCKNCVRANSDATVCLALSQVLRDYYELPGADFPIAPEGCCNWNKSPGQKPPRDKKKE